MRFLVPRTAALDAYGRPRPPLQHTLSLPGLTSHRGFCSSTRPGQGPGSPGASVWLLLAVTASHRQAGRGRSLPGQSRGWVPGAGQDLGSLLGLAGRSLPHLQLYD